MLSRHNQIRRLLTVLILVLLGLAFMIVQNNRSAATEFSSPQIVERSKMRKANVQERDSIDPTALSSSREEAEMVYSSGGGGTIELNAKELHRFLSSSCFRNSSAKKHPHTVVNVLDGKEYQHHPVIIGLPLDEYHMNTGYITEVNGLKVPAEYDCDNLNGFKHWGAFPYFYEVPSRWHTCWSHYEAMLHHVRQVIPTFDYVDDEYIEQVAIYHSVLRAKARGKYAIAELGARWGTWGSRAIALWKRLWPGYPYALHFVEADKTHCSGIHRVMEKNNISFSLSCDFATEADLRDWANSMGHIDLIDFDIQKAERDLVPKVMDLLNQKVLRIICGTHSEIIHDSLLSLFRKEGWREIWSVRAQSKQCTRHVNWCLRRAYQRSRISSCKWTTLLQSGCWHQTPYGPVAHFDGQLIFDNPNLAAGEDGEYGLLSFKGG